MSILNAMAVGVAMGGVVYMLKEMTGKREIPTDIGRIIQEGVVRSDIWGSIGEMDGFSSAITMGQLGMRDLLGPDTHHAYHGSSGYMANLAAQLLGPSFSSSRNPSASRQTSSPRLDTNHRRSPFTSGLLQIPI